MPKFYGQNKKRFDPRYFMDEKTEQINEAFDAESEDPTDASQIADDQIDIEAKPGDGTHDVKLDLLNGQDFAHLNDIVRHLNTVAGGGKRGELFQSIMKKLGIELNADGGKQLDLPGLADREYSTENEIIDDIREFSKDVTGSRDTYGSMEKLEGMSLQELEQYFRSLI